MTRARDIANLVDANGDIVVAALSNVPPSNDASALTTGTLDIARITAVDASALTTGTLNMARISNGSITAAHLDPSAIASAGTIAYFGLSAAPTGWIKADGATISRSVYADLFTAIGTTYGAGDGSTTFAIPDLRGEFVRGVDNGRGVDSGRSLGTSQAHEILSHAHDAKSSPHTGGSSPGNYPIAGNFGYPQNNIGELSNVFNFAQTARRIPYGDVTITSTGGSETRPRNVAFLACIKY